MCSSRRRLHNNGRGVCIRGSGVFISRHPLAPHFHPWAPGPFIRVFRTHQRPTKFFAPSSQHLTISGLYACHPILIHHQTVLACNQTTNSRQNVRANPQQEARYDCTVSIWTSSLMPGLSAHGLQHPSKHSGKQCSHLVSCSAT